MTSSRFALAAIFALLAACAASPSSVAQDAAATPPAVVDPCDALLATAGTPTPTTTTGDGTGAGEGSPDEFRRPIDLDLLYIDLMIPHHEAAVLLGEIAVARAARPELAELGARIVVTQRQEIEQLRAWRAAWYGEAPPVSDAEAIAFFDNLARESPGLAGIPGAMEMVADAHDPAALCATTVPFDLAFIDEMIPHHESAVLFSRAVLDRIAHPELGELARAVADGQEREIAQMLAWRDAWFAGTPAADHHGGMEIHSGSVIPPTPTHGAA